MYYFNAGMLLMTFVVVAISQQEPCKTYGDCDPGPDCETPYVNPYQTKCLNCCDGGYFNWDKNCDGINHCVKGTDEKYCEKNMVYQRFHSCLMPKEDCKEDSECCSYNCKEGICWDEQCD